LWVFPLRPILGHEFALVVIGIEKVEAFVAVVPVVLQRLDSQGFQPRFKIVVLIG